LFFFVSKYGMPCDREIGYLHRLGRTGRIGKSGKGLLVALPFESRTLARLKKRTAILESQQYQPTGSLTAEDASKLTGWCGKIQVGHPVLSTLAAGAYLSFVAFYLEYSDVSVKSETIQQAAVNFATHIGLSELPTLPDTLARTAAKKKGKK